MSLSIRLPKTLEEQLAAYCAAQGISRSEAVKRALDALLSEAPPTPYELGAAGFGADNTHGGDIARNSKRLLQKGGREFKLIFCCANG
jgi:hypothetical protein